MLLESVVFYIGMQHEVLEIKMAEKQEHLIKVCVYNLNAREIFDWCITLGGNDECLNLQIF